jgi:transmembrane sensor
MSLGMESSRQIEEGAAAWLAKRDSGHWSEEDECELQTWLDASTANTVAFIRLEAVWGEARRLKALGAGVQPNVVPPANAWRFPPFFEPRNTGTEVSSSGAPASAPATQLHRRGWLRYAVAAGLVLVAVSALTWYVARSGQYYHTPVGGLESVPMADGSKVTLNTDSAIRLAVTEKERGVLLERGEAFFDVAKDPGRPFVVRAGSKRVIAVGTRFSVRRTSDDVRVFVTEGTVRVEGASTPDAALSEGGAIFLAAGSVARAGDSGILVQKRPLADVEDYLTWRAGYVTFRETPLAEAIAEFNRYNDRKMIIRDPEVAAIRVSGKFRSNRFEAFVRLLEQGFPIQAQREGDRIVLTDSRGAGGQLN